MKTTSRMIVRNHASPLVDGRTRLSPVWICAITHATAVYKGLRKLTS
jgi:hypothetical protein